MKLFRSEKGQDLAEYGIGLAVIAAGVVLISLLVSKNVQTLWSNAATKVSTVTSSEGHGHGGHGE